MVRSADNPTQGSDAWGIPEPLYEALLISIRRHLEPLSNDNN